MEFKKVDIFAKIDQSALGMSDPAMEFLEILETQELPNILKILKGTKGTKCAKKMKVTLVWLAVVVYVFHSTEKLGV